MQLSATEARELTIACTLTPEQKLHNLFVKIKDAALKGQQQVTIPISEIADPEIGQSVQNVISMLNELGYETNNTYQALYSTVLNIRW